MLLLSPAGCATAFGPRSDMQQATLSIAPDLRVISDRTLDRASGLDKGSASGDWQGQSAHAMSFAGCISLVLPFFASAWLVAKRTNCDGSSTRFSARVMQPPFSICQSDIVGAAAHYRDGGSSHKDGACRWKQIAALEAQTISSATASALEVWLSPDVC